MIRWIYLASRGPGIAKADFAAAWLNHARLASGYKDLLGLFRSTIYLLVEHGSRYDAVGFISVPDAAAIDAALRHEGARSSIHPDEIRVFGELIANVSMAADTVVLRDGAIAGSGAAAFLRKAAGVSSADFERAIRDLPNHGSRPDDVTRCVMNRGRGGLFPSARHAFDAVLEFYGTDESLRALTQRLEMLAEIDAAGCIFVTGRVIMNWMQRGPAAQG
jgi:hypothetical protein